MGKIPKDPSQIYDEFVADYKNIFGKELVSVILYGSCAKGEYRYKSSDINFLIVLSDEGIDNLGQCLDLIPKWKKYNVSTPQFLTKEYITTSLDSFPIEFFDMKEHHKVIYGEDVLADLMIRESDLRLQCEREVKGDFFHLREGYLNTAHNSRHMRHLISQSLVSFASVFSALLKLRNSSIPEKKMKVFLEIAKVYDLDSDLFEELLRVREGSVKRSKSELKILIEKYIQEIKKLTKIVDQL